MFCTGGVLPGREGTRVETANRRIAFHHTAGATPGSQTGQVTHTYHTYLQPMYLQKKYRVSDRAKLIVTHSQRAWTVTGQAKGTGWCTSGLQKPQAH